MCFISLLQIVVGPLAYKLIYKKNPFIKESFLDIICAERYKLASNNFLNSLICKKNVN